MPELPDVQVYIERLEALLQGHVLRSLRISNPFVLRTVEPPPSSLDGRTVTGFTRVGKRIAIRVDEDVFVLIHLMIAGRLRWRLPGKKIGGRIALAEFVFDHGSLHLTEAGTRRRAMLHIVRGSEALGEFERGGLDVFEIDAHTFAERLRSENHTLKRSLTDPRMYSGIGNAYSDEILHRARLSPLALSGRLSDADALALYHAARETLAQWTERLRGEVADGFPEKVTAFHADMAVHGRFGQPCPVCAAPVQRIRYAANETNYCARCQTGGRVLADRALSRLLGNDWPRSIDELE